jgi:ubiquinone/menaquinone biosynthesis C-methylase UbiE
MNEVACGDGRYACAISKIFLSQNNGSSIGPVMIKDALSKAQQVQVEELLST